jgi:hypothetical protein
LLLFVLVVLAVLLTSLLVAAWQNERQRNARYALIPVHELVERAKALIQEGDPNSSDVDTTGDFDPWRKTDLLDLLSKQDYRAMLQSTRPGGDWWYVGPYDLGPSEDMRRMDVAHRKNRELRAILTELSRRGSC